MSRRKEIFGAIQRGEYAGTGWDSYGRGPRDVVREIKRLEAEERNAATPDERRRARRVWTTRERRTRHYTAKGGRR